MKTLSTILASSFCALSIALPAFAGGGAEWSYDGKGTDWGTLSKDYAVCSSGKEQSPINIQTGDIPRAELSIPKINWKSFTPEIVNNGHTIQVNTDGKAGFTKVNGKKYQLLQFHFHHGSEHTLNDEQSPMEVHFVHQSEEGDLLVVGAMIEEGEENQALKALWSNIPEKKVSEKLAEKFDSYSLIPEDHAAFRYKGSLTTPPCTEIVTWNLMEKPVTASKEQIEAFAKLYPNNFRPVQDVNRRFVLSVKK